MIAVGERDDREILPGCRQGNLHPAGLGVDYGGHPEGHEGGDKRYANAVHTYVEPDFHVEALSVMRGQSTPAWPPNGGGQRPATAAERSEGARTGPLERLVRRHLQ